MIPESKVREIVNNPYDHEWSIQGLGMLRTYLDDAHIERLHIWLPDIAENEVSTIHDHPWDFDSLVYFGQLKNQRYVGTSAPYDEHSYLMSKIHCGEGGGLVGDPIPLSLIELNPEYIHPSESYHMFAPELHESYPLPGTVSIIKRNFHEDRDTAHVLWPKDKKWGTAEPRPVTKEEIDEFTRVAKTWM